MIFLSISLIMNCILLGVIFKMTSKLKCKDKDVQELRKQHDKIDDMYKNLKDIQFELDAENTLLNNKCVQLRNSNINLQHKNEEMSKKLKWFEQRYKTNEIYSYAT